MDKCTKCWGKNEPSWISPQYLISPTISKSTKQPNHQGDDGYNNYNSNPKSGFEDSYGKVTAIQ